VNVNGWLASFAGCGESRVVRWLNVSSAGFLTPTSLASATGFFSRISNLRWILPHGVELVWGYPRRVHALESPARDGQHAAMRFHRFPDRPMVSSVSRWALGLVVGIALMAYASADAAVPYEPKPTNSWFLKLNPRKAPETGGLWLQEGDRLAIIGDSITEQKMYSRIMETYLTVCVPGLKITTRQYGWSGETAEGFLRRMTNDCLRFQPTVATLCYGMNDHRYRPFDVANGEWYRENYTAVVRALKAGGARVALGSPGCVSKVPHWTQSSQFTLDELNVNLCALRDIDIGIAKAEQTRFADVFWTMFKAGYEGQTRFGTTQEAYLIGGKDGVHPGWAGHLVMAYAFLRSLGLDGNIGVVTVDLSAQRASASAGHVVNSVADGVVSVTSSRYPFCATGEPNKDDSIRSGMEVVPFNPELNRFQLIVKNGNAAKYQVTWGDTVRTYAASELATGVNLAADFAVNPFSEAFHRVDEAVAAKQAYETKQVKSVFHGDEGRQDMEAAVKRTEAERAPLVEAIRAAFVPVKHAIKIQAAEQ
jgi:lysophospholipase L1-like esterase